MSTLPASGGEALSRSGEMRRERDRSRRALRQAPSAEWPDDRLIEACLAGRESAWEALVAKYQAYVYSIIVRSGATAGEEDDVFQGIWIDVYNHLEELRSRGALRAWLATITRHKCYHWRLRHGRLPEALEESWAAAIPDEADAASEVMERSQRDQEVREAIGRLRPRCRQLLTRLFLEDPPRPYAEVAGELGLAEGSIGSLRARCLERLKRELEKRGFVGPGS